MFCTGICLLLWYFLKPSKLCWDSFLGKKAFSCFFLSLWINILWMRNRDITCFKCRFTGTTVLVVTAQTDRGEEMKSYDLEGMDADFFSIDSKVSFAYILVYYSSEAEMTKCGVEEQEM